MVARGASNGRLWLPERPDPVAPGRHMQASRLTKAAEMSMSDPSSGPTTPTATLPQRLTAGDPGWQVDADIVLVGSGIAGLSTALRVRELGRVLVVTKDVLSAGSTQWAQGGIAAAIGPGDTPEHHLEDTLVAGAGLCDDDAVRVPVTEGPQALRE